MIINHGRQAGASIAHPHGQLLGIPFVPRELAEEQAGFDRFAGGCLLCASAAAEERVDYRILQANDQTVTFCPYWSGTPYEILVVPRDHGAHLHRASTECIVAVGRAVRSGLRAITECLGDVAYNVVFHSAPYRATGAYHWHVHILPCLTTRAGFELGTGVMINVVGAREGRRRPARRPRATWSRTPPAGASPQLPDKAGRPAARWRPPCGGPPGT